MEAHATAPEPASPLPRVRQPERFLYPLATLVVVAVTWEVAARQAGSLLIPTFSETIVDLLALVAAPDLWAALASSNIALILGFTLALILGVPIGLALGRFTRLAELANPYLTILLTLPMAGVIPLLVMSVGIRLEARIAVVFLFAFPIVVVNSRAGVREVDPRLIEMARSFGASELRLWQRILLPASVPAVMAGVRFGLGQAVTGMVVVELLLVASGIGYLVLTFQSRFDPGSLYATVLVVVLESLLLISVADRIARFASPWAGQRR